MKNSNIYADYHYPAQIISHSVWLYRRFTLSFRDIEELLATKGIVVSYETIRQGQDYEHVPLLYFADQKCLFVCFIVINTT